MKRIFAVVMFLVITKFVYAEPGSYTTRIDTNTFTSTMTLSGMFRMRNSTTAAINFEIIGGSIILNGTVDGRNVSADGTNLDSVQVDTGTIQTALDSVEASTGTLQTDLATEVSDRAQGDLALGLSTATLQGNINTTNVSTGTLLSKSSATATILYNAGGTMTGDLTLSGSAIYYGDGSGLFDVGTTTPIPPAFLAYVNESGGIAKGLPVYVSGVTGNRVRVKLADCYSATVNATECDGIAVETKSNNDLILIRLLGILSDFDTSSFSTSDNIYLGNKELVNTQPSSGTVQHLGHIERSHGSLGSMLVSIDQTEPYMAAPYGIDIDIRMGKGGGKIHLEDGDDNSVIEIYKSSTIFITPIFVSSATMTGDLNSAYKIIGSTVGDTDTKLYGDASSLTGIAGGSGGDMYKTTYDTDLNNIVDNSEKLDGNNSTWYANATDVSVDTNTLQGLIDAVSVYDGTGVSYIQTSSITVVNTDTSEQFVATFGTGTLPSQKGLLISSNNVISMPKQPAIFGYLSAGQNINPSVFTTVQFDTFLWNDGFTVVGGTFTFHYKGGYTIYSNLTWGNIADGTRLMNILYHNGSSIQQVENGSARSGTATLPLGRDIKIEAGDTIYIEVYQTSGGVEDLIGGLEKWTNISIHKFR